MLLLVLLMLLLLLLLLLQTGASRCQGCFFRSKGSE